ncbi:MAG: hypothetical protein K9M45_00545 [Kiritimatiellales bacterium]|nr:hypothetical protein [Kiritimatiellales bacterium]
MRTSSRICVQPRSLAFCSALANSLRPTPSPRAAAATANEYIRATPELLLNKTTMLPTSSPPW